MACGSAFYWLKKAVPYTGSFLVPSTFAALISMAAKAAERMPRLQVMELWNHDKGQICIFTYLVKGDTPTLTIQSTWHLRLWKRECAAWTNVARMHGHVRRPLLVKNIYLDGTGKIYHSYACAMTLLTHQGILNGTSERQIRSEIRWRKRQLP
ncbi:hypothetical protein F5B21DRAFT_494308 [Xylaria acuta]|nr:hypothetical protein F5B21DRAFT_494308 [Xylaria acuta]